MNEGKKFEQDFKRSLDECSNLWVHRPSDFGGGQSGRFTNSSLCDFVVFDDDKPSLYLLELKSVQGKSISCPSYSLMNTIHDLQNDIKTKTTDDIKAAKELLKQYIKKANGYDIKYHQIKDLYEIECKNYTHIYAYFVINFRSYDITYYCTPSTLLYILKKTGKSSININDFVSNNVMQMSQSTRKTRKEYNVKEILCQK